MKIVSFTMVNNESEIIESFIRYNSNYVDQMVVIDNGCTDNTIEIIRKLILEGYCITVYDESLEAYNQFRLDNKYLDKIITDMQPDLILPLDADEFIIADTNPRRALEELSLDRIYYINWQWYVMTEHDDPSEAFIPKRLQYCLDKPAWNYADGSPVTKTIIPARYFKEKGLTLSMGHHTVFGNNNVSICCIQNIKLAHYRAISEQQLIYKTCCYTMRDIATMENNSETAQRTNQMALIERGNDMWKTAVEASYAGYPPEIIRNPIDLQYCTPETSDMKYACLAKESISNRIMRTGREMAIRTYNLERQKKEKPFLKPIVLWLDNIRYTDIYMPNPTNHSTVLTSKYNVRAYLTLQEEIRLLKTNYRLIVTPDLVKFIPHEYIVIPNTSEYDAVVALLSEQGYSVDNIITLREYRAVLGFWGNTYCAFMLIPALVNRMLRYIKLNGLMNTIKKLKERFGR